MTQPLSLTAVFIGKNPDFQAWAAKRMEPDAAPNEETARRYIYAMCDIKSRAELNRSIEAAKKFSALQSKYRQSIARGDRYGH